MKTRLLIIIGILIVGFTFWSYIQYTHYETWGNNEHWYYHPDGYDVECEIQLFQSPSPCKAIDEYGTIVDIKTELGNWAGVKWLGDSDFCKESGGIWNDTARGCYGLYEMCEEDGGIPRFFKKSLPFPDVEENKPIKYLMDCYYMAIDDTFLDEPVFTGTLLLNDANTSEEQKISSEDERKFFCESHEGKWSDEFHNCVGGSMEVSCDIVGASELKPPNVFGKIITEEGTCISHELFCKSMGGNSTCMSYEQKGHGRDICIVVCEFVD